MKKETDTFGNDLTANEITKKRNKVIIAVDLIDLPIEGIPKIAQIVAVAAHFQNKINAVKREKGDE